MTPEFVLELALAFAWGWVAWGVILLVLIVITLARDMLETYKAKRR